VLVSGPGAAARNSIGIVLVSGMAIGTLFTLLVLPAVYLWLAGVHEAEAEPAARARACGLRTRPSPVATTRAATPRRPASAATAPLRTPAHPNALPSTHTKA
jgi:hypothetical protein